MKLRVDQPLVRCGLELRLSGDTLDGARVPSNTMHCHLDAVVLRIGL